MDVVHKRGESSRTWHRESGSTEKGRSVFVEPHVEKHMVKATDSSPNPKSGVHQWTAEL